MINNYSNSINLNNFFKKINSKKQYKQRLKNKILMINNIKKTNFKALDTQLSNKNLPIKKVSEASYIIDFSFSRNNTTMNIMDCSGNIKSFYSAGLFKFSGKQKTFQVDAILKKFYKILVQDLSFLRESRIVIHFKNKNTHYRVSWLLKKLREKFFIISVKFFTVYPFNGCRRKKQKRKKF